MSPPILQVITDTDRRGAQVFAVDLGDALAASGHEIRTVAMAPGAVGGLDVEALGQERWSVATVRALRREARRADVVVAHGSSTLPACAFALAGTHVPVVYRQISDSLFWADTRARRIRVRQALRRMDRVVALWAGAAEVLRQRFGVAADDLRIIANGVPVDRFPELAASARPEARRALGLAAHAPTIAYIGALATEKGVDVLVDATARLPDAQLLIAGDGPERAALAGRARDLLGDRCHFTGSLDDPREALAAADVVALTCRGGDSMPAALIEAGLSGLPVVATPVGGIVDIVDDGRTGRLVAPGDPGATADALRAILEDPAEARRYGRAARTRCTDLFGIERIAADWAAVIDELLQAAL